MSAVLRATAMLVDPAAAWRRIEGESADQFYLLTGYVALLALIPALCGFIGACVIGVAVPGSGSVRAPLFDGVFGAIFGYMATFVELVLIGLWIDLLAPRFGGRRDLVGALKLAIYSFTPLWLAGIFLLLPGLQFLVLTGFYGGYLLAQGLAPVMKSRAEKTAAYTAVVVAFAAVLTLLIVATQRALFGTAGL